MSELEEQAQTYLRVERVFRVECDRRLGQNDRVLFVEAVDERDAASCALPGQRVVAVRRATEADAAEMAAQT